MQSSAAMSMAWLIVTKGPSEGKSIQLREGANTIGRSLGNDLQIDDASVSRSHAMVIVREGRLTLVDLGSTGGTRIGQRRISGKTVGEGSVITVGQTRFRLVSVDASYRPASLSGETVVSSQAGSSLSLIAESGPDAGKSFLLSSTQNLIGRDPSAQVVLSDPTVSRRHAMIRIDSDRSTITDLGSRSGTNVDGELITGLQLTVGDHIAIGQSEFALMMPSGSMPRPGMRVGPGNRDYQVASAHPVPGAAQMNPAAASAPVRRPQPASSPRGRSRASAYPAPRAPIAPATPASRSKAPTVALAIIAVIAVSVVVAFFLLQDRRTDEQIAEAVAREWSSSSIDDISELTVGFLVGNAPVVTQIGGSALADRIRDNVAWSYSTPDCQQGRCDVTATARANLDINIPLVMNETATIELPFDLEVDTGRELVTDWNADIASASVSGIEFGGMGQGAGRALESSDEYIRSAIEKLEEFSADEDLDRVIEDSADILREVVEDEDVQRTLEDASDRIQEGLRGLFGN